MEVSQELTEIHERLDRGAARFDRLERAIERIYVVLTVLTVLAVLNLAAVIGIFVFMATVLT